jgi:nicotinate-nucleotide pyrophosphorylase (carboxylating)
MGDITTDSTVPPSETCRANLIAKEDGVIAGLEVFERTFMLLDPNMQIERFVEDGDFVAKGTRIMFLSGNARAMLKAERTALNLLQRMSGIASLTRRFAEKLKGTDSRLWIHERPHPVCVISINTL